MESTWSSRLVALLGIFFTSLDNQFEIIKAPFSGCRGRKCGHSTKHLRGSCLFMGHYNISKGNEVTVENQQDLAITHNPGLFLIGC